MSAEIAARLWLQIGHVHKLHLTPPEMQARR
jgi:hypothetical protein